MPLLTVTGSNKRTTGSLSLQSSLPHAPDAVTCTALLHSCCADSGQQHELACCWSDSADMQQSTNCTLHTAHCSNTCHGLEPHKAPIESDKRRQWQNKPTARAIDLHAVAVAAAAALNTVLALKQQQQHHQHPTNRATEFDTPFTLLFVEQLLSITGPGLSV
jgi:hypothetical protein